MKTTNPLCAARIELLLRWWLSTDLVPKLSK
jgi:hypothetical protein